MECGERYFHAITLDAIDQYLSKLTLEQKEEIEIRRRDGAVFSLKAKKKKEGSPFDVPGIKTKATTQDILRAVKDSRRD